MNRFFVAFGLVLIGMGPVLALYSIDPVKEQEMAQYHDQFEYRPTQIPFPQMNCEETSPYFLRDLDGSGQLITIGEVDTVDYLYFPGQARSAWAVVSDPITGESTRIAAQHEGIHQGIIRPNSSTLSISGAPGSRFSLVSPVLQTDTGGETRPLGLRYEGQSLGGCAFIFINEGGGGESRIRVQVDSNQSISAFTMNWRGDYLQEASGSATHTFDLAPTREDMEALQEYGGYMIAASSDIGEFEFAVRVIGVDRVQMPDSHPYQDASEGQYHLYSYYVPGAATCGIMLGVGIAAVLRGGLEKDEGP